MNAFPNHLRFISTSRNHGAVNGIALISSSHKLLRFHEFLRPRTLYRVIHGGQPDNGLKSRLGRGSDPIFFQLHLQKHLRWRCRESSPFLSATNSWKKAMIIAAVYAARAFTGLRIIKFKTSGLGWNHGIQRLWSARSLIRQLGLNKDDRPYFNNEFLIEHSIPQESIIARFEWEEDKEILDPDRHFMTDAIHNLNIQKKVSKRQKEHLAEKKKKAEEADVKKRKADGLDDSEPQIKKRKTGEWVKVGIKMARNVGA
ncbi:hypothetical protein CSPAE12_03646 [Colletotrichum incanum]|nr:hypothetical protein CSPAE12_03646 [Colletotrichum incanum]